MPRKKKNLAVSTPKEKAWFTALYNPFTVSGLKPNTTYTSKLHVVDKLGDRTEWGKDVVFTTYPPSPVINDFNVELGRPSDKNIVVTFNLEVFSDIKNVQVITDDAQILYSEDDFGRQTEYTIKIGGLTPEKRYTVFVLVEDEYGQTTKSNFMGVTMMPEKPIITDILVVTRGQDFLELLVEYESKVSISNYKYEVNKVTHNTNDNPYRIGGLVIGTEYPVTVTITDKNGNLSEPFTKSIITSTEGPVITKLDITSITQTSATFTVTATSKLPVKDYTFYFNNKSQTQKSNVYKATGLSPYTEYFVTVIARDELDIPSAELTKNFRTASDGIKVSSCTIDNPTKSTVDVSLKFSTVTPIESVVVFVDYGSGYIELEENPYNETDFTVYGLKPNSTIKNMKFNITNVAGEKIDYVKSNVNIALEKSNFEIVSIDVSDITQETALVSATVNSDYPIIKYELYLNDKLQETQTSLPFTLVGLTANTTYNLRLVGYDSYNNSTSKTGSFKTILELFTVGFSVGNGTEVDGIEVPSGTVINLDDYETELDGYDFLGWYIEDTKYTGNYTVTQNVVFEAKWDLKQVTITYMSFDKVVKTEKVNYGGNGTPPEPEYVEGYTFVEWTPTPLNVTSDLTVTAVYEQSITEVTYDAVIEGYTAQPLKQDVPFNDKFTTGTVQIPNNERKLVNWSYLTDDFDTVLYKPSTEYTMDVLYTMYLTAVYDKYKTTFNAGEGATLSGSQPSLTPVGTEITALNATLSRTGINNNKINAKLLGWSFDQAFQNIIEVGEKFEQLDSDSAINAYWEYPITYYDATGISGLPSSLTVTSADITIPSGTSTTAKEFLGWEIYIDGTKQSGTPKTYTITKGSTGFYEFKALWKKLSRTIVYNVNGGTMPSGSYATEYTNVATNLPQPTRANYTFAGWSMGNVSYKYSSSGDWTVASNGFNVVQGSGAISGSKQAKGAGGGMSSNNLDITINVTRSAIFKFTANIRSTGFESYGYRISKNGTIIYSAFDLNNKTVTKILDSGTYVFSFDSAGSNDTFIRNISCKELFTKQLPANLGGTGNINLLAEWFNPDVTINVNENASYLNGSWYQDLSNGTDSITPVYVNVMGENIGTLTYKWYGRLYYDMSSTPAGSTVYFSDVTGNTLTEARIRQYGYIDNRAEIRGTCTITNTYAGKTSTTVADFSVYYNYVV